MTVTYGVIGCGMMGREHLQNIALLEGARVGAIFEPDAGMAAACSTSRIVSPRLKESSSNAWPT